MTHEKIRFTGEGEDGKDVIFDSWRELAKANATALIDAENLSDDRRQILIAELEDAVSPVLEKRGGERVMMLPSGYDEKLEPAVRFAVRNLERLRDSADQLLLAELEAEAAIFEQIGGYDGFAKTFVKKAKNDKWTRVPLPLNGPIAAERLVDLVDLNLIQRLEPLWHAISILKLAAVARDCLSRKDTYGALQAGIHIGEARKGLSVQLYQSKSSSLGGSVRSKEKQLRDAQINEIVDEITQRHKGKPLSKRALARHVYQYAKKNGLDWGISEERIRRIIRMGHKGS